MPGGVGTGREQSCLLPDAIIGYASQDETRNTPVGEPFEACDSIILLGSQGSSAVSGPPIRGGGGGGEGLKNQVIKGRLSNGVILF